jgi:molecular chaperone DnaJ
MSKQDYYELLGVTRDADGDAIKKAFRKAAMKYHPDKNPGDKAAEQKFKELNEAHDVLKDEQKRAAYDRFGHAAFEQGMAGARAGGGGFGFTATNFSDIFDEMFSEFIGGRRGDGGQQGRARGADLRYNLTINLQDAFGGKQTNVRVPGTVSCEACHGSGGEKGAQPVSCQTCRGAGRVRASQGFFTIERTCPNCQGRGETIETPCPSCNGGGRVTRERTLSVTIPIGVEDGTRIRLAGEGEAGVRGGPPGDLYIFLSIKPHEFFQRDGADLFCRVPIAMTTAALGGQIEVPTIDGGRTRVKIPEGTETGKQFRMKSKGMPVLRSKQQGDLYIQVEVETPKNLSRKQRDLLKSFEEASNPSTSPASTGFFARVKEFFEGIGE